MSHPSKGKRGGDVKKPPEGYYTARQARERLGMNPSTFGYKVRHGQIKKYVPPMRVEGFYDKKEIDALATQIALDAHTRAQKKSESEVRLASPEDVQGIHDVLASMGWQATPPALRLEWYKVNPFTDFVVASGAQVMGYLSATPYKPRTLAGLMAGRTRAWDITPDDILPYRQGRTYDLFVGIAIRSDAPNSTRYASQLIRKIFDFINDLVARNILVHRLYAVSDEPPGQRLCQILGFTEQPPEPGDQFPRYVLDLETSESHFARLYRHEPQP